MESGLGVRSTREHRVFVAACASGAPRGGRRQFQCPVGQVIVDDFVHEAVLAHRFDTISICGQQDLPGTSLTDDVSESLGITPGREDTEVQLRLSELRPLARDDEADQVESLSHRRDRTHRRR